MAKDRSVATAEDVARLAGVSQSAVSRTFTPGASVAPATRMKILAAAEQLGYQPNLIARSLTSGRSNIIGVGIGNLENPFFVASLERMSWALAVAGLRLLLFPVDRSTLVTQVQEVLQYRLEALVLLSVSPSPELEAACRVSRIPIILYNRKHSTNTEISSVTGDNEGGGRTIADHLLAGNHKRFAFLAGVEESTANRDREAGFRARLSERGSAEPLREVGGFSYEGAAAATRRLLVRRDRPDAIFCANDQMALAAIDVARGEFGFDVGREVSIVGFDNIAMAAWPSFSLTTYTQSCDELVRQTVELVLKLMECPEDPEQRVVEGRLVVRGSTRPPQVPTTPKRSTKTHVRR
jgi:DNA-binding LacI/PurR family transcriptional regulator